MVIQRCEPAKRLYIAIPAYTGEIKTDTAQSLIGATAALALLGVEVRVAFQCGCCYLDHARNLLVNSFRQSDATDLLLVDSDVGFKPETVVRMAQADRPFLAAIYPKKNDEPAWPVEFPEDEIWADAQGFVEAAMVPTGFLRLNREIFNTLGYDTYSDNNGEYRAYFRAGVRDGKYIGEDVDICRRWRGMGGRIFILPEEEMTHTGPKAWTGSWGAWMRGQPREEAA